MTTFKPVNNEEAVETNKDFPQEFYSLLTDIASISGFAISAQGLDILNTKGKKLANLIDEVAIARCEKLQKAVLEAFNHLEERVKSLEGDKPVQNVNDLQF